MSALSCHPEARSQSASAVSSRSTTSREKLVSSSDSRMAQMHIFAQTSCRVDGFNMRRNRAPNTSVNVSTIARW